MIDTLLAVLTTDAMLTGILTGGIYRAKEISRQTTPAAYDANRELRPCALVRQETTTPWGPHDHSGRVYVTVWFYQRDGYAQIEAARARVYALLHRTNIVGWDVRHINDLLDMADPALHVPMAMSRYQCTVNRE